MLRISSGKWRGRKLADMPGFAIRPALLKVRQAIMNICGPDFLEGAKVLDLFSGSGSIGLEALSRGAGHAVFVERDSKALGILEENLNLLQVPKEEYFLLRGDVYRADDLIPKKYWGFDILFVDPPYPLFSDEQDCKKLVRVLDALKEKSVLAGTFLGFMEAPLKLRYPLEFQHLKVVEVRKYGQTNVMIFE